MKKLKILAVFLFTTLTNISLSADGIWQGVFDINGHGRYDFTGLVNNQDVTAYTEKAKVVYRGEINITEEDFIWSLKMYLQDGTMFGTAVIKGKILNGNIMSGKWSTEPAKDYGNIYLIKNEEGIEDAGNQINRAWTSINSKVKQDIVIEKNKILGKDENGCNYYGDINNLNNKIYMVNLEIASCGISDGVYNGMAHIEKNEKKSILKINATNKNFSLLMIFE
tara:strand:- start:976 stop:1644 length:669 start_codon:yes stop_codon:yes gene_type:complete